MFARVAIVFSLLLLVAVPSLTLANTTGGDADGNSEAIDSSLPGHWTYQNLNSYAENQRIDIDEATRRIWIEYRTDALVDAVMSDPEEFGGAWINATPDDYTIIVNTLGNGAEEHLAALISTGDPVAFTNVEYSLSKLRAAAAGLNDSIQAEGLMASAAPDIPTNMVAISYVGSEAEGFAERATTDDGVTVEAEDAGPADPVLCTYHTDPLGQSRDKCTPYRGGTMLQRQQGSNTQGTCTITLWARNDSGNGLGHRYLATAGHCSQSASGMQFYWHDSAAIGESNSTGDHTLHGFYPATDGRLIRTVDNIIPFQTTNMNKIYKWSGEPNQPVTTVKDQSAMTIGQSVCKSGVGFATYGSYCGTINSLNTTVACAPGFGCTSYGALKGTMDGSGGDSGAVVWDPSNDKLYGLGVAHIGTGDAGDMLWVSAQSVENNLFTPDGYNLGFCMNDDCTAWDDGN